MSPTPDSDPLADAPREPSPLDVLESVRPDSHDLADPELAAAARAIAASPELIERRRTVEAADRAIGVAIRDVPLPPGLAERIRAALAEQAPAPQGASMRPRRARRRAVWASAVLAASLLAGVAYFYWPRAGYESESIPDQVQRLVQSTAEREFEPGLPPKFRLPAALAHVQAHSWTTVQFFDQPARLVRLSSNGMRATLVVAPLRGSRQGAPRQVYSTGKLTIGVIEDANQLCVLAVEGDKAAYHRFLSAGAVASIGAPVADFPWRPATAPRPRRGC